MCAQHYPKQAQRRRTVPPETLLAKEGRKPMTLTMICDMPVSRRQKLHYIIDGEDRLYFSAAKIGACLEWFLTLDEPTLDLETEHGRFRIEIEQVGLPKASDLEPTFPFLVQDNSS